MNPILDNHYVFSEAVSILRYRKYISTETFVLVNQEFDMAYRYNHEFIDHAKANNYEDKLRRLIVGDESIPYADLIGSRAFAVRGDFIMDYYPVFTIHDSFFKSLSFVVSINREPEFDETIKIIYHTIPNLKRNRPSLIPPSPGVHTCNCCVSGSACQYKVGRYIM